MTYMKEHKACPCPFGIQEDKTRCEGSNIAGCGLK